jgi:hypothetical protein
VRFENRSLLAGIAVLAVACAAAAATISSPLRGSGIPVTVAPGSPASQQWLQLDRRALATLASARGHVELDGFPIAPGSTGRLLLDRFEVASPRAQIVVEGVQGPTSLALPEVAHFGGTLEGDPDSRVYVGVQADRVVAVLKTAAGLTYVGPDESKVDFVVRTADSPSNFAYSATPWSCAEEELPGLAGKPAEVDARALQSVLIPGVALKQAAIRVDTDQELLAKFSGSPTAMANWILSLFGAMNVIYERDLSLHLTVVEIHAWTTADPYDGPATIDQLTQLGSWWGTHRPIGSYPRWTVHLLSGRSVTGGVAWLDVTCPWSASYGYGVTQVYGDYPAHIWDLFASSHEIGHNAGSPHTHCYSPPIDKCYSGETGCYVGPTSVPADKGTIMSYCHLLPGGYNNIKLVFHSRCIDEQMLPLIDGNSSCMTTGATFADVPPSYPFFDYIEALARSGVTSGCGGNNFCPDSSVTRAQMAVFLLRSKLGSGYVPPPCTGKVFGDVPCGGGMFDPWIEDLAARGITNGCGGGNYCPNSPVTRAQMAIFLLRTPFGSGYVPPPCSGTVFGDVPCKGGIYDAWIEDLAARGITKGCGSGNYCPNDPNTRGQMAVFLVKTFGLLTTLN